MKFNKKFGISLLFGIMFVYVGLSLFRATYSSDTRFVFEDENFYNCVVNSYNNENTPDVSYTTNLTEQQLKKITTLNCSGDKITSVKGIEKITNLKHLDLSNNYITEIDLSKNTMLLSLDLYSTELTKLDISANVDLRELDVSYNDLTILDVSKNTLLTSINANGNRLTEINLSNNIMLQYLNLSSNCITNLNLEQNIALYNLDLSYNQLTDLDVSKNTKLVSLAVYYNNLDTIDLSKNIHLAALDVESNNLTKLNVSNNTLLTMLYAGDNNLEELDVSKNDSLVYLDVYYNNLKEIDVSKNTLLEELYVDSNNLTSIDLSNNQLLGGLGVSNNNFDILDLRNNINLSNIDFGNVSVRTLYLSEKFNSNDIDDIETNSHSGFEFISFGDENIISPSNTYKFNLNRNIVIPEEQDVARFINNLGLTNLSAKIFNGSEEVTSGNVLYGNVLKIYDVDNVVVQELPIVIFNNEYIKDENFYKCIIDNYNDLNDTDISYSTNLNYEQLQTITSLDCSMNNADEDKILSLDGIENLGSLVELNVDYNLLMNIDVSKNTNLTSLSAYGNLLVNFVTNDALIDLDLGYNYLESIDLGDSINLKTLFLDDNYITNIDLSENVLLENVDLSYNELQFIDVSENIKLKYLDLYYNYLKSLDVTSNIDLKDLDISYNDLTSLDVNNNKSLNYLYVSYNYLKKLDLSTNTELNLLYLNNNKLNSLSLNSNVLLSNLNLSFNNLTNLDLSSNLNLKTLNVKGNNITNLDLSNSTKLTSASIYGNTFKNDVYVYKNKTIELENGIGLPSSLSWSNPNWRVIESDIANVEADGTVNVLNIGKITTNGTLSGKYNVTTTINVVEITSDKYEINEENDYIVVGSDDIYMIKNNIKVSDENIILDLDLDNNKLLVKYGDVVLKEFNMINIRFTDLDIYNNMITFDEVISYEDFVNKIKVSDGISYKLFNGEEEVTTGDIAIGMNLKVYYNDELISTIQITDYNLSFDSTLNLNTINNYINYLDKGQTVSQITDRIHVVGGGFAILDTNNNIKSDNSLIATGDRFVTYVNEEIVDEYTLSVMGDANGDGNVGLIDLVQLRKHIVKWVDSDTNEVYEKTGVYYDAIDLDKNGSIGLVDLVRVRKIIVGIDEDE